MSTVFNKIFIASDHRGFFLKKELVKFLKSKKIEVVDLGTNSSSESVDFPDYAKSLSNFLKNSDGVGGILICGSGIGMSISANRNNWIRCALVSYIKMARLCRLHNDANVLAIGADMNTYDKACKMVATFLETESLKDERYKRRNQKISCCCNC